MDREVALRKTVKQSEHHIVLKKMNKKYVFITYVIVAVLSLTSCNVTKTEMTERDVQDRGFYSFISGIEKFPYIAPEMRKRRIIEAIDRISINMTCDEIKKNFIEPDYITRTDAINGSISRTFWAYYVIRNGEEVDTELDKGVFVYFNDACHVIEIEKMNL